MVMATGIIFVSLTVQLIVGLTYHGGTRWPFLSYPMYATSVEENSRLADYTVRVVSRDGNVYSVDPDKDLGLTFWIFRKNYIRPIIDGTAQADTLSISGPFCAAFGPNISRLEVYDIGVVVTKKGAEYLEPGFVAARNVNCPVGDA